MKEAVSDLKNRTKRFALNVIEFVNTMPKTSSGQILGKQLLRAATSVGANYRASCKSRSRAEFIAKIGIVEEEADECCYWLELILESKHANETIIKPLINEANAITAIMAASRKSAIRNSGKKL